MTVGTLASAGENAARLSATTFREALRDALATTARSGAPSVPSSRFDELFVVPTPRPVPPRLVPESPPSPTGALRPARDALERELFELNEEDPALRR